MTAPSHSAHRAIDVHAHYYPQSFLDLVAAHGAPFGVEWRMVDGKGPQFKLHGLTTGPVGPRFTDLDARLAAMDEQRVAVHVMSLSQPMVYWADRALGDALSRIAAHNVRADRDIIVIDVDDRSLEAMASPAHGVGRFPWPRAVYGELVDELRRQHARAIVFDIELYERDLQDPRSDAVLNASLADSTCAASNALYCD